MRMFSELFLAWDMAFREARLRGGCFAPWITAPLGSDFVSPSSFPSSETVEPRPLYLVLMCAGPSGPSSYAMLS